MNRVLMSLLLVVCAMTLTAVAEDAAAEPQLLDEAVVLEADAAVAEELVVEPAAEAVADVDAVEEAAEEAVADVEAVEEAAEEAVEDVEILVVPEEVPAE